MRIKEYLKNRYAAILSFLGIIFLLTSGVMLTPLLVLITNPEEAHYAWSFIIPAASMALLGLILYKVFLPKKNDSLSVQEGGIIVVLSWLGVILFSMIPLITVEGLTFSQAVFESTSAWTTTGLSVVDVENSSKIILIWRSIIQLAGGAGLAIIMMSAIVGPTGVGFSSAEGRGDQLVPQVRASSRLVLSIYLSYAFAGTIGYWFAGMEFFDAVNHSFAAVSTGGFSTKSDSIGYWDSVTIEAVTFPLMILGNLSFLTAFFLFKGKFRSVFKNGEVRILFLFPLIASLIVLYSSYHLYPTMDKAIRVALFETTSALTTTGFSTVGYGDWKSIAVMVMLLLMLTGGGTYSTAGGLKQFRIYFLYKFVVSEIKRYLLPNSAVQELEIWKGDRVEFINESEIKQIVVFVFVYLFTYSMGVLILTFYGYSLSESLFEYASALGTVGLSIGVTSADMPEGAMWAITFAMFMGRLEFIIVITSLVKFGRDVVKYVKS